MLFIGEQTVTTHVSRVPATLDLRDRFQAVVYVYEHDPFRRLKSGP